MDFDMTFAAPCLFGLESLVKRELEEMGIEILEVRDGRVLFAGRAAEMCRTNIRLRTAERVLIRLASFRAASFDDLFEGVKAIDWAQFIDERGKFIVNGHCLKSRLMSVPDCQRIIKKAMADRLCLSYKKTRMPETGSEYKISFLLMNDNIEIMLDSSGEGLHKRGYRAMGSEAPLKETLAAAIVQLSRFRPRDLFIDPMCGSGTIAIEAALIGAGIAPGLRRTFAFDRFEFVDKNIAAKERNAAREMIKHEPLRIEASDIDPAMCALTKSNAALAGVGDYINVTQKDAGQIDFSDEYATVVVNPPYGERMFSLEEADRLYRRLGQAVMAHPKWSCFVLTANEDFEKSFGRRADKKRKLYNGMIKCDLYQYFKLDGGGKRI